MERIILIRMGEIFLKGENRKYFEKALFQNIQHSVERFSVKVTRSSCRYYVSDYRQEQEPDIVSALTKIFGIHSVSIANKIPSQMDEIKTAALRLAPDSGTFRITTNRAFKNFPLSSMQVSREIGAYLLEKRPGLSVDLHQPQHTIQIDIREDGFTYLFEGSIECERGMPYGTSGKGVLLLSGGIDSPVAGYLMAKRGMTLTALHFHSFPYTSEQAREKVIELARQLKEYCCGHIKMYIVPVTEIQEAIHEHCPENYMITILRRFMMRIANEVARADQAQGIITGESLGQVASQTIQSIQGTNAVAEFPVLRPLIGVDKTDIVSQAKKIGTFETSIQPYEDCCTVFLPKNPVIKPKIERIEQAESRLDCVRLIEEALAKMEVLEL